MQSAQLRDINESRHEVVALRRHVLELQSINERLQAQIDGLLRILRFHCESAVSIDSHEEVNCTEELRRMNHRTKVLLAGSPPAHAGLRILV